MPSGRARPVLRLARPVHRQVGDAVLEELGSAHAEAGPTVVAIQMSLRVEGEIPVAEQADDLVQQAATQASAAALR